MSKIAELSNAQLMKLVINPLTRDEALAELDARNAVAIQLANAELAESRKVVDAVFPGLTPVELSYVVRLMKPAAPKGGITPDVVPSAYINLRNAIKVVLASEGINPWKSDN